MRAANREMGGGGVTQYLALPVHSQGVEGDTSTRQWDLPACNQGTEEGGGPPKQHHVLPTHDFQE